MPLTSQQLNPFPTHKVGDGGGSSAPPVNGNNINIISETTVGVWLGGATWDFDGREFKPGYTPNIFVNGMLHSVDNISWIGVNCEIPGTLATDLVVFLGFETDEYVDTYSNQVIGGDKVFTGAVEVGRSSDLQNAVNLGQIRDMIASELENGMVGAVFGRPLNGVNLGGEDWTFGIVDPPGNSATMIFVNGIYQRQNVLTWTSNVLTITDTDSSDEVIYALLHTDTELILTQGTQLIEGLKTFDEPPVVPNPVNGGDVVNLNTLINMLNNVNGIIPPTADTILTFNDTMTANDMQNALNGVGKELGGFKLIVNFTDGSYTFDNKVSVFGFRNGLVEVKGNPGDSSLSTTKAVNISHNDYVALEFSFCDSVTVNGLRIAANGSEPNIKLTACGQNNIFYSTFSNVSNGDNATGVHIIDGSGSVKGCQFLSGYAGVRATRSPVVVITDSIATGGLPTYGVISEEGSQIRYSTGGISGNVLDSLEITGGVVGLGGGSVVVTPTVVPATNVSTDSWTFASTLSPTQVTILLNGLIQDPVELTWTGNDVQIPLSTPADSVLALLYSV